MILLQAYADNTYADNSGASTIAIVFLVIVGIIIQVLLIRWVFRIDTQVNNQRAMLYILMKMAEKQGVTHEDIENWKQSFKVK